MTALRHYRTKKLKINSFHKTHKGVSSDCTPTGSRTSSQHNQ